MKTVALALVFLAIGVGLGVWTSSRKFVGEELPSKGFLAYLEQQRDPQARRTGPRLVLVGSETHDFGSMDLWAKGTHTFVLRNEGTETLKLVAGKPTCSCTVVGTGGKPLMEGDTLELKPGEQREFQLDWEIKSSHEQFSQSAPFTTNDELRPNLVLAIVGRVEESIRRTPEALVFNNVPISMSVIEDLLLETNQTDALEVTGHRWLKDETSGFFEARFEPAPIPSGEKKKSAVKVSVTLKPGLPLGGFEQTLEVTTNLAPAVPPILVPVQGTIVGDLSIFGSGVNASSQTFSMGVIPQGRGAKRTFHVLIKGPHRDDTSVTFSSVEPSNLRVQVGEPDTSNAKVRIYPITVEIPADAPPVNFRGDDNGPTGRLVLATTHPTFKQLEVRLLYLIRQ